MELRECPFCGDNLQWDSTLDGYSHNDDSDCFFSFVCIPIENAEDWNPRHSDAAIKELVEAIEDHRHHFGTVFEDNRCSYCGIVGGHSETCVVGKIDNLIAKYKANK